MFDSCTDLGQKRINNSIYISKWCEQRTEFLLTRSGSFKFIHSFLMLGSEGRQRKHCFFHYLALHCFVLRAIFTVWFPHRPARSPILETTCMSRWAELNRQWCRSRHWSSFLKQNIPKALVLEDWLQYKLFLVEQQSFAFWSLQDIFIAKWPLMCQKRDFWFLSVHDPLK